MQGNEYRSFNLHKHLTKYPSRGEISTITFLHINLPLPSDPDLFTISYQKILFYPPSHGGIKITNHQKIQQENRENRWKESAKLPQYSFKRTGVKTELPTLEEFGNIFNFNKR